MGKRILMTKSQSDKLEKKRVEWAKEKVVYETFKSGDMVKTREGKIEKVMEQDWHRVFTYESAKRNEFYHKSQLVLIEF